MNFMKYHKNFFIKFNIQNDGNCLNQKTASFPSTPNGCSAICIHRVKTVLYIYNQNQITLLI